MNIMLYHVVALCITKVPKVVYNFMYKYYIHELHITLEAYPKHTLFSLGHCFAMGAPKCM